MRPPGNILYIIQGEMSILLTAMRRGPRWSGYSSQDEGQDSLLKAFAELKVILSHTEQWEDLDPSTVITPFLNVIRDNDTPGPVTGLALGAVNKLLSYHIIDPSLESAPSVMESIADAVTHARFVGTETSSDEVVLVKILQVLRTLLMIPSGYLLSNESVCEIMQSCFRLCFEPRLSELLRRSAEHILSDLTQLLFTRLAEMTEDDRSASILRKLKMRSAGQDGRGKKKAKFPRLKYKRRQPDGKEGATKDQGKDGSGVAGGAKKPDSLSVDQTSSTGETQAEQQSVTGTASDRAPLATTPCAPKGAVVDLNHLDRVHVPETVREYSSETVRETAETVRETGETPASPEETETVQTADVETVREESAALPDDSTTTEPTAAATGAASDVPSDAAEPADVDVQSDSVSVSGSVEPPPDEAEEELRENPQGVRFTGKGRGAGPLVPYGLPCVREVLNFFASLTCPMDRNNSDFMIHCGLGLLAVALETGADQMARLPSLMALVNDEICRNLFSLMNSERLSIFSAALRCCLLLFEALRGQTKFQLEMYVTRLTDIVVSENPRTAYEQKELALDALVQLWKVPGLVTELYLNYDCDPYCSNLFEDVTKLLSKNAFPVQGVYSTHLLSLDALLTVVDSIEHQCHTRIHAGSTTAAVVVTEPRPQRADVRERADSSLSPAADALSPPTFPASGYLIGCGQARTPPTGDVAAHHWPPRRPPVDHSLVPTHEELMAVKHKKKLLASGTEHFNVKPAKGIQFLQDNGLLSSPLDPKEVVNFIKENPRLDKKMIGEYISNRKNLDVLDAFVKSFDFTGLRVDESLRLYLETFRLPGEAPVISLLMEHFADHWHKSNDEPFANADAAFTLAYAIIMLNVDQHNHNVRKNTVPMTREDFKRNLKKVNGGSDFNQEMLDEIYTAIKSDEIVMPAEQTGLVRENYLWRVLLRRGAGTDGSFVRARSGTFDHDLFSLSWGPTVAALSFVFDRASDEMIVQKAIGGFRKCAMIAAHYGMSDVFDNLVISLCKFTTLGNSAESPDAIAVSFGGNWKAQLAARTLFSLTHRHGDMLRDGWRNLLDILLQLYRCRLLSDEITEAEDFLSATGRVPLRREPTPATSQRTETSLLSSLYSYIALGSSTEPAGGRAPTPEEREARARARRAVDECQPELLVNESKFLRADALQELVKALILASHGPDGPAQGSTFDEDSASFFLEILIKVVIQNRDRAGPLWQSVRNHIYSVVMSASAARRGHLMERGIVGLLRLVIRLVRREELTCQVLQSLRMLLLLRPSCLQQVSRQAAAGLHELLRTAAGTVTAPADWAVLFALLECVGAGARPPAVMTGGSSGGGETAGASDADPGTASDGTADSGNASDKCYSDSELYESRGGQQSPGGTGRLQAAPFHSMSDLTAPRPGGGGGSGHTDPPVRAPGTGGWILVGEGGEIEPVPARALPLNQFNITHERELLFHDAAAFSKSVESLSLLIRDAAHVTAANFGPCVQCLRTYVEASLHGRHVQHGARTTAASSATGGGSGAGRRRRVRRREDGRHHAAPSREYDADESDSELELPAGYHQIAIQLLDLMHTLHTRAAHIFGWFGPTSPGVGGLSGGLSGISGAERRQLLDSALHQSQSGQSQSQSQAGGQAEGQDQNAGREEADVDSLWETGWCPLLQGIARLCCDTRKQVRASAVTYLQRSLLVHDLQALSPAEWEACFHKVLFPLLAKLLEPAAAAAGLEETRMRAATLLCKVFLQHLTPLLSLPTFTALWLTILDFMDKYLQADRADLLHEAIPESMKNMLLVMETAGIFHTADGYTELWVITWDRIDTFLPSLREQVFSQHPPTDGYTELWVITWDRIDTFLPSLREQVFSQHPPSEINRQPSAPPPGVPPVAPPTSAAQKPSDSTTLGSATTTGAGAKAGPGVGPAGGSGTTGASPRPGAGAGATAGVGGTGAKTSAAGAGGATEGKPLAPSMREIRPASPLHHEELMTSAPSVILGPPLPPTDDVISGVSGGVSGGISGGVSSGGGGAAVPLVSLSALPPGGPVFLRPLPPPGVAAPASAAGAGAGATLGSATAFGATVGVGAAGFGVVGAGTAVVSQAGLTTDVPSLPVSVSPIPAADSSPGRSVLFSAVPSSLPSSVYPSVPSPVPFVASPIPAPVPFVPSSGANVPSSVPYVLPSIPSIPSAVPSIPSNPSPVPIAAPTGPGALPAAAAMSTSDVTTQSMTSVEQQQQQPAAGALPVFRMPASEGSDDFL